MPFTISQEAMKKQMTVNIMRPQEQVPDQIPPNFSGTMSQGLPVKQIPVLDFPRVLYMHPNEAFHEVEHRNANFEVVGTEVVASEHLTKLVENQEELEAALVEGWVKEPYVQKPRPNPLSNLYGPRKLKGPKSA